MSEAMADEELQTKEMNRHWQYSDGARRRVRWNMNRIIMETRRRGVANASVRRKGK